MRCCRRKGLRQLSLFVQYLRIWGNTIMLWKRSRNGVRPAKKKDLDQINALRRQLHELRQTGRPDVFQKPYGDETALQTRRMLYDKKGLLLVTESDGVVCGFVYAVFVREDASPHWDDRSYCKIEEICVDKSCRGQGFGTRLMDAVRKEVAARDFPKMELNVWAFNAAACSFWTKQGFTPYLYCMESKAELPQSSAPTGK